MTDNEIIKALECCSRGDYCCDECPLRFNDCVSPILTTERLMRDAISLINRQKAEIERLENGLAISKKETKRYAQRRSEAIKAFAERLEPLKKFRSCMATSEYELSVTMREIDNLVKEMVGDAE